MSLKHLSMIPFLDLKQSNQVYHQKFVEVFQDFLDSGYYILGEKVSQFEKEFAEYCGTNYCVGTGNGLDALKLILRGYMELGRLKSGDKIIVAANTFIATILAIKEVGLEVILVEPNEKTYTLDADWVEAKITPNTQAILTTHLYGQLSDMKKLKAISVKNNLLLLSDNAQSQGVGRHPEKGLLYPEFADASGYSFYPTKNLGALGDAGAITTDDKDLAKIIGALRNYGSFEKYKNEYIGYNSRLDEVQAAFLLEKLKDLDSQNQKRRKIAKKYKSGIRNEKIKLPFWEDDYKHVFHLFVVRVENRDAFTDFLKDNQIGFLIHYPIPPHKQKALPEYADEKLPLTEKIHEEVVSIPLYPGLTEQQINRIIDVLNKY